MESRSGDVTVDGRGGDVTVRTGSGDLNIERLHGGGTVRTGAGDVTIDWSGGDLEVSSGSGDLSVETFDGDTVSLRTTSGDVSVGVPSGVPVWQDLHVTTGDVTCSLDPVGQPADGQRFITVRASTSSGDINLNNR